MPNSSRARVGRLCKSLILAMLLHTLVLRNLALGCKRHLLPSNLGTALVEHFYARTANISWKMTCGPRGLCLNGYGYWLVDGKSNSFGLLSGKKRFSLNQFYLNKILFTRSHYSLFNFYDFFLCSVSKQRLIKEISWIFIKNFNYVFFSFQ